MTKSKSLLTKIVSVVMVLALLMGCVFSLTFTASAATTYYLRGSFDGADWPIKPENLLTDNGDGTYSVTKALKAGTHEYKFSIHDWSWNMPQQNATITLAKDALIKFTMNPTTKTYSAKEAAAPTGDVFVRGSFDGDQWPVKEENKFISMGNNNFYLVKTLPAGIHEYKIATADWSWNVPSSQQNACVSLAKEGEVLFEVNTLTGSYKATPILCGTAAYTFDDTQDGITIKSAWDGHTSQTLCENSGKLGYTTGSTNTKWSFIPVDDEGVYCYIKNDATGNYLYADKSDDTVVLTAADGNKNDYGKWFVDFSTGKYRIFNVGAKYRTINVEKQDGKAYATHYPAFYLSSQFTADFDYGYSYTLTPNGVVDTKGMVTVNSETSLTSTTSGVSRTWTQENDTSDMPIFNAPNTPLAEAVYNLSMEETVINQFESEFGTALLTGETWYKVWTRDTAMSCEFSLAAIYPDLSLNCAKEKVVSYENIYSVFEEDTGTGGSYPVSTDKIITYLSVWEIYLSTGDESVLEYFYDICMNTINQDYNTAYDAESGLIKGETCGLDWRSQTYPDWMGHEVEESLANIAEGKAASVNLIYLGVLDRMIQSAEILGKDADIKGLQDKYDALYEAVTTRLWHEDLGCYAAWEYPSYMGSPLAYKVDSIANGYALWFEIGSEEQLQSIAENYPLVTYGANTTYPTKQGDLTHKDRVYHNRGVWPGWEAQLMLAGAEHGYDLLSEEIWNSCITAAATSLVNKEVVDFTTGEGIHVNHQLWSIASTLSGYYKVLFGMIYDTDGITFEPYIPQWMEGPFYLNNYTYCDATIDLSLTGKGSEIVSITVNGKNVGTSYTLPFGATGHYDIDIVVKESTNEYTDETVNLDDEKNHVVSPKMPVAKLSGNTITWGAQAGTTYLVWDGVEYHEATTNSYTIDPTVYGAYSVVVVSEDGVWSEMSRPIIVSPDRIKIEAENCSFTGNGIFKETKNGKNHLTDVYSKTQQSGTITIKANIKEAGQYLFWACYNDCSSNNPESCSNCAIRSVFVDGKDVGALVFPVVDYDYQTSTHLLLQLSEGDHEIVVKFDKDNYFDYNMSQDKHTYGQEVYNPDNTVQYDYFVLEKADTICIGTEPEQYLLGDADANGDVNVVDAAVIQKHVALIDTSIDLIASDVNGDGDVNVVDASFIQKHIAQIETGFDIGKVKTK